MPTIRQRIRAFRNPQAKSFSNEPWVEASVPLGETMALGRRPSDVTGLARMYTQWPYRCATINAQAIASIPLRVYRERTKDEYRSKRVDRKQLDHVRAGCIGDTFKVLDSTDKMDEVTDRDHPIVALLNRPSPWMSGFEHIEALGVTLQLAGTTFDNIVQPEDSPPTGLNFMPTPWTRIAADKDQYVSHYLYGVDGSTERRFEANEVIRIKMPNPTGVDQLWGIGPLQAAYLWHEVSNNISVFQSTLFERGGFPSIIGTFKGAHPDQLKAFESKLRQKIQGSKKAGEIIAVSGDVNLTKWNMSQEELGFLQASKDMRDFIAAMFGVPQALLSVEDVNLANGQIAAPQWQLMTIRPLSQRIEDAFNTDLMPRFRAALGDPSLCVAFDNPVTEDVSQKAKDAGVAYQNGGLTLNEYREEMGYDSVEGRDDFFSPAAAQPALGPNGFPMVFNLDRPAMPVANEKGYDDEPIAVKRSNVDDESAPDEPVADSDPGAEAGDRPVPGSDSGGTKSGPVSERLALFLGTDHDEVGHQYFEAKRLSDGSIEWKDDDDDDLRSVRRFMARSEADMDAVLQRYFDRLLPEITDSLTQDGRIGLDLSPDGDAAVVLRDMLGDSASEAFMFGVETGLRELGERATEEVVRTATDRARAAAEANLIRLSESTLATVKEGAESIAQDVLARTAGEDFREVQRQLGEELQGRSTNVTRRIARTESNRMHSDGRLASWKESGVVARKRWITRGDSRVAEPCLTINRQYNTADLDEPFVKAGQIIAGFTFNYDPRGLMAPPAKPNCRCTMIAED